MSTDTQSEIQELHKEVQNIVDIDNPTLVSTQNDEFSLDNLEESESHIYIRPEIDYVVDNNLSAL